jgi:glycosyltransferase involved in cell wall biosynthesis
VSRTLPARRRVVHYVDSEIFGGCEEAALQLLGSLDLNRWEPVLLYHPGSGIGRLVEGAARLDIRTRAVPRVSQSRDLAGLLRIWRVIREERPAIFHAHLSWPLACKYGVLAAWLARVPSIVGTAQLYMEIKSKRRPPLTLRFYHRIIAVSEEVKTRFAQDLRIASRKLVVVRNGIRVSQATHGPNNGLRSQLIRGQADYVVLTPARLHEQKGHAILLQAAARVPDATFVFAGDGPLRAQLEQQAQALGISGRSVFLGHRWDIPDLLAAADLLVLPSLYEGLPVSVLEAMAAERPVVATSIGGTKEAVIHEVTGLLVPTGDPVAMANAIDRLRGDPAFARRLAVAGRLRVQREFSSAATAQGVMRVYDEVTGHADLGHDPHH